VSVPILKRFSAENGSPTKTGFKMAVFRENRGLNVTFYFQNPKRHILARNRVFDVFCVKVSVGASVRPMGERKNPKLEIKAMPTPRHCNTGRICQAYSLPPENTLPYLYTLFRKSQKIRAGKITQLRSVLSGYRDKHTNRLLKSEKNTLCTLTRTCVVRFTKFCTVIDDLRAIIAPP